MSCMHDYYCIKVLLYKTQCHPTVITVLSVLAPVCFVLVCILIGTILLMLVLLNRSKIWKKPQPGRFAIPWLYLITQLFSHNDTIGSNAVDITMNEAYGHSTVNQRLAESSAIYETVY